MRQNRSSFALTGFRFIRWTGPGCTGSLVCALRRGVTSISKGTEMATEETVYTYVHTIYPYTNFTKPISPWQPVRRTVRALKKLIFDPPHSHYLMREFLRLPESSSLSSLSRINTLQDSCTYHHQRPLESLHPSEFLLLLSSTPPQNACKDESTKLRDRRKLKRRRERIKRR